MLDAATETGQRQVIADQLSQVDELDLSKEDRLIWYWDYLRDLKKNHSFEFGGGLKTPGFDELKQRGLRLFVLSTIPYDVDGSGGRNNFSGVEEVVFESTSGSVAKKEKIRMTGDRLLIDMMEQSRFVYIPVSMDPVILVGLSACDVLVAKAKGGYLVAHIGYKYSSDVRAVFDTWSSEFGVMPEDVYVVSSPISCLHEHGAVTDTIDYRPMTNEGYEGLGVAKSHILDTKTVVRGWDDVTNLSLVCVVPDVGIVVGYENDGKAKTQVEATKEKDVLLMD
jgi:hypothetical protein